MENQYKEYEKTIKKEHSFSWTPKYETEFSTVLTVKEFISIAEETITRLGWDLVHKDENSLEAKRKEKSFGSERWTEAITVTFDEGKINVQSISLGNEMWDVGRNSKRVKLFVYAFQETEKNLSKEDLNTLVVQNDAKNNWDHYVIPETLPEPGQIVEPKFYIPVTGGVILAVILALTLAKVSISGVYIIGAFEIAIGIGIGFAFNYLMRWSNYTDYNKLHYVLMGVIGLTYILNQYFQYELILHENHYSRIGFDSFLKLRLEQGLTVKKVNTGWLGLIISWILQLVITYCAVVMTFIKHLTKFQFNRVAPEVIDFAFYHFVKDKTEDEVRVELALKGWTQRQHQDEVFEAIGAIQTSHEMDRTN